MWAAPKAASPPRICLLSGTLRSLELLPRSCLGKLSGIHLHQKDCTFILSPFSPCVCTLYSAGLVLLLSRCVWGNTISKFQKPHSQFKFRYPWIAHLISNPSYNSCLEHCSNVLYNQNQYCFLWCKWFSLKKHAIFRDFLIVPLWLFKWKEIIVELVKYPRHEKEVGQGKKAKLRGIEKDHLWKLNTTFYF